MLRSPRAGGLSLAKRSSGEGAAADSCTSRPSAAPATYFVIFRQSAIASPARAPCGLLDAVIGRSNPQKPVQLYYPDDGLLTPLTRRRGLRIGNLTRQCFASVYLDGLNYLAKQVLHAPYMRCVDDFALFDNDTAAFIGWRERESPAWLLGCPPCHHWWQLKRLRPLVRRSRQRSRASSQISRSRSSRRRSLARHGGSIRRRSQAWSSESSRLRIRSNRRASAVFRRPSGPIYPRFNIAALRELRPVGCRQAIVSETPYPRLRWPALVDRLGWPARGALAALDPDCVKTRKLSEDGVSGTNFTLR